MMLEHLLGLPADFFILCAQLGGHAGEGTAQYAAGFLLLLLLALINGLAIVLDALKRGNEGGKQTVVLGTAALPMLLIRRHRQIGF